MQEVFESLEHGAVLVTATRRLARVFRQDYAAWQRDRGRTLWTTPLILPLDAYVRKLWSESLSDAASERVLLSGEQEALVWAQIIRDSPQGDSLLQAGATARRAMEAWALLHRYRLPLDDRFQATDDCAAFLGWAREFERRCARNDWLDGARLPDAMRGLAHRAAAWFTGFDELSPQQREFLDALGAKHYEPPLLRSVTRTKVCDTAQDEIRCAAEWARGMLDANPAARIGIVVLDLPRLRSKVERIFRDVLQPGAAPEAEPAFHISLGRPVDRYPMIYAALRILDLAAGPLPLTKAGMLLRSPFLRGAGEERIARAALDAGLRRSGGWEYSAAELRNATHGACPVLNRSLWAFEGMLAGLGRNLSCADCSRTVSKLLEAIGWPGDRTPGSREHQLMRRWTELLSEFATMDAVSGPVSFSQAVERLRELASQSIFQFEDTGAPVQISDHLEIAGVRFDHLWIMGLHDEALPAAANPNPFLPISLQRERRLPNASAERQQEAARFIFERLTSSARDVALSYPRVEGDRALSPSPLLTARAEPVMAHPPLWIASIRASAAFETIVDEAGPPLIGEDVQRGGVRVLSDVAACPFRAFALHRLDARQLDEVEPGLNPRQRGTALHEIMKRIWSELASHAALCALAPDDLASLVRRNIAAGLDQFGDNTNVSVERVRLERLLTRWMEVERKRPAFTVVKVEEKKLVEIGGLKLEVRADRVDALADERELILDYKTGDVKAQGWSGPRLDEPQVPLYCVSSERPIAAAAFACIRAEWAGFKGVGEVPLPDFRLYGDKDDPPLREQIGEWRVSLASLAEQFRAGDARVDPKNDKTCEYCAIVPLCRIREYKNG